MAKIIHTGDIHLDSPFATLSYEKAKQKRESLRSVVSNIIDIADSESADAIIIAGDLFDTYPIYAETAQKLISDFSRTEIPIFITPGNHDPYTSDSPYKTLDFPSNVHIFNTSTLSAVELSTSKLRIFGAAYMSTESDNRPLSNFKSPDDDFINLIVLHSEIDCTKRYSPVSVDEIAKSGADYVALGHTHKPSDLLKAGSTHYAYCGIPEARDFGEAYDTSVCIVDITKNHILFSRQSVSDVRYREATLDISDTTDIMSSIPYPAAYEHLRLTLTGECHPIDIEKLSGELSSIYCELVIQDKTTVPYDIWEGMDRHTLRGIFLNKTKALLDACEDDRERKKIRLAAKLGIDAIENREL